jgi:uncharacterized protein
MNKFIVMMTVLVVALSAGNSSAWNAPASPAPASWIADPGHVLSDEAHARLDASLKQINQGTANEVAALIVPSLDGENVEDVAHATFNAWGMGKQGLDNGVLVVLAMKEHKSRIETGKGVEGDLPDLKCSDILQAARPYLRKGNVEGALSFIFTTSANAIANHKADVAAGHTAAPDIKINLVDGVGTLTVAVLGGLFLLFILVVLIVIIADAKSGSSGFSSSGGSTGTSSRRRSSYGGYSGGSSGGSSSSSGSSDSSGSFGGGSSGGGGASGDW